MRSLWHSSWESVQQQYQTALSTSTDALPLALQLGVCATATPNCSSHLYRCLPSALVLSMWFRLASTNVFEHYKPSMPIGQAIYPLLLHQYEIQCLSLGGTTPQSVYWVCIIQCILYIRKPLAVELYSDWWLHKLCRTHPYDKKNPLFLSAWLVHKCQQTGSIEHSPSW